MYYTNDTDSSGRAAIQMWSGNLQSTTGGTYSDMVLLLINGNNSTTVMNATLADIFVDSGPAGTSTQVRMSWEVRDLWANRMSTEQAAAIIASANSTSAANATYNATLIGENRYNATQLSYAEGLAQNDSLLLGNVTTTVQPSGTVVATVSPHGAAMFRLRALPAGLKKRDEL